MFVITGNSLGCLEDFLVNNGIDRYRASQVFHWIYENGEFNFSDFSNLPKTTVDFLKANCVVLSEEIVQRVVSKKDNTAKFLIKLSDGCVIESVLLCSDAAKANSRLTACISTQVGCAVSCAFCASGKSGFKRNLSTSEIVSQYLLMRHYALLRDNDVTNIVFMGIGEPFLNYDNLMGAVDLLTGPQAAGIGARKITISTAGVAPAIDKLADYKKQVNLSISLHSAFDKKRDSLVPLNKKHNLKALLAAVKRYTAKSGRMVTFEYALIKGINDLKEDAAELGRILKDIPCKINLIPYNPTEAADFKAPSYQDIRKFISLLQKNKIPVIERQRRGIDINSGCGQLRASFLRGN